MSVYPDNWAAVIPLANEEPDLPEFISILSDAMNQVGGGTVYFIVMMILISIAKRGLDFSFYIERFGVMPIVFVILGWGMEIMNRQAGTSPAGHHH